MPLFVALVASALAVAEVDLASTATASASSFYAVPPYEDAFLPALAIDGDEETAWSSLHEGCAAELHLDLAAPAEVATVCARSRDMVDDPNVPRTDDSVIETYALKLDGRVVVNTCVLPDWRRVYCCSLPTPTVASRVTLAAQTCRERAGGPGNTGFKTVRVYATSAEGGVVNGATLVGNRNAVAGASEDVNVVGSDSSSASSDNANILGHDSRMLSSDDATVMGVDNSVINADRAIVLGYANSVNDADGAVLIGANLTTNVPMQVVIGSHGAITHADFAVAAGSAASPRNILEVYANGTIANEHIAQLEARIAALEAALPSCGDPASCAAIKKRTVHRLRSSRLINRARFYVPASRYRAQLLVTWRRSHPRCGRASSRTDTFGSRYHRGRSPSSPRTTRIRPTGNR